MQVEIRAVRWHALLLAIYLGVIVYMDARGAFMYLTYWPAVLSALGIAAWTASPLREHRSLAAIAYYGALSILIVAAPLICRSIPTSSRKSFFLLSNSLVGLSLPEVNAKMQHFRAEPFRESAHEASFGFRSAPGTTDVIIVTLKNGRVCDVEFSPD